MNNSNGFTQYGTEQQYQQMLDKIHLFRLAAYRPLHNFKLYNELAGNELRRLYNVDAINTHTNNTQ